MKYINKRAPIVETKEVTINAPISKVWAIQSDINQWSTWNDSIETASLVGDSLTKGSKFAWKTEGLNINSEVTHLEDQKLLVWKGKLMGVKAIHSWELRSEGDKTVVSNSESMEGMAVSMMKRKLRKTLLKGMDSWLAALKLEAEK